MARRNVLMVCYANISRSQTAEDVFAEMASGRGHRVYRVGLREDNCDFEIASAGINAAPRRTQMTEELGEWAHEVYAADHEVYDALRKVYFVPEEKMTNLAIPDDYSRDDPDLICILKAKFWKRIPYKSEEE